MLRCVGAVMQLYGQTPPLWSLQKFLLHGNDPYNILRASVRRLCAKNGYLLKACENCSKSTPPPELHCASSSWRTAIPAGDIPCAHNVCPGDKPSVLIVQFDRRAATPETAGRPAPPDYHTAQVVRSEH